MKRTNTVLVTGAILAASLVLAACDASHDLTPQERQTAELGARQYAGASSDVVGTPSGLDSDGDGYVTATIKDRASGAVSEIVCSYRNGATGCKMKVPKAK